MFLWEVAKVVVLAIEHKNPFERHKGKAEFADQNTLGF